MPHFRNHRGVFGMRETRMAFAATGVFFVGATALNFNEVFASQLSPCQETSEKPDMKKQDDSEEPTQNTAEKMLSSSASSFQIQDFYDIEKILGEGTYGLVYQARRKVDGVLVALKTMPRRLTGKTDFEREVAALQLLSKPPGHAHIVQLYDLHRDDQNYYLAMELIEGGELLEHLIENGPYSEGLAASFLRQFAEALCFVHRNGLSHADLKPENLLLSSNDAKKAQLKVADFGCARSHDLNRQEMQLPMAEFAIGCSFLHMVALGNQFELEKMLQERPNLVNFRDYDFRTPLHLAASEGHVDICRFLVERGARVNRSDRWGGSPLDDAHRGRHSEVSTYLREQGATFGAKTQLPRFIQAASDGDKQEVEALLEFGNIDIDEGDYDRRTALHLSSGEGRKDIVELLCRSGANPNVEDRWQNRPLDDAKNAKKNSDRIMSILVKYGARSLKHPNLHQEIKIADRGKVEREPPSSTGIKNDRGRSEKADSFSGTIAYWPPELFGGGATPTPASDMWAAGVIMYVLLTGTHPFDKDAELSDEEIQERILSVGCDKENYVNLMNEFVFDERIEGLSESCVELMRTLLDPDPDRRLSSDKFLRHPWVQGLTASWTTMNKTHDELKAFWQNRFRMEILKKFADTIGTSSDQLAEADVLRIFEKLDTKKNGVLELEEIQDGLSDLGLSDKNIRSIFSSADLDGTGVIHFDEFQALFLNKNNSSGQGLHIDYLQQRFKSHIQKRFFGASKQKDLLDKNKLRDVFTAIDLDGDGVWDANDIRQFLRSSGEPEDVISRIVASLDRNRSGRVSWSDFCAIMG
ncbi:protein kinase family protein [Nitzschia inconspicua]|uniref:Protein kinase family protein n=1 Tax=Nitzschia inconspicua TaxID=303405 RepID=A0A9K3LFS5_9STRA|nr:protein kinase family protein [Nitzschia inconspicua]